MMMFLSLMMEIFLLFKFSTPSQTFFSSAALEFTYVSLNGIDEPLCGTALHPCKTLLCACNQGKKVLHISIGAGIYTEATGMTVNQILMITGQSQTVSLLTPPNSDDCILFILSADTTALVLTNLTLLLSSRSNVSSLVDTTNTGVGVTLTFRACRIMVEVDVDVRGGMDMIGDVDGGGKLKQNKAESKRSRMLHRNGSRNRGDKSNKSKIRSDSASESTAAVPICGQSIVIISNRASIFFNSCTVCNITTTSAPFLFVPYDLTILCISNTSFVNVHNTHPNTASGGSDGREGSCFYVSTLANLTITNSLFIACSSTTCGGVGSVECLTDAGEILACAFWNNSVLNSNSSGGGALRVQSNSGHDAVLRVSNTTCVHCVAAANFSTGTGGGVFAVYDHLLAIFAECSFAQCSCVSPTSTTSQVPAFAWGGGGAIHGAYYCGVRLLRCTVVACGGQAEAEAESMTPPRLHGQLHAQAQAQRQARWKGSRERQEEEQNQSGEGELDGEKEGEGEENDKELGKGMGALSVWMHSNLEVIDSVFADNREYDIVTYLANVGIFRSHTDKPSIDLSIVCDVGNICTIHMIFGNNDSDGGVGEGNDNGVEVCSSDYSAEMLNITCSMPCASAPLNTTTSTFTSEPRGSGHERVCVMPWGCPPDHVVVRGQCVPACVFWRPSSSSSSSSFSTSSTTSSTTSSFPSSSSSLIPSPGSSNGNDSSSTSTDTHPEQITDTEAESDSDTSVCSPLCVPDSRLGYTLCAAAPSSDEEKEGEGEGEEEGEGQGGGEGCFSAGWLCPPPPLPECSARVPDTNATTPAQLPCGTADCYLDMSMDMERPAGVGVCAAECAADEHFVADAGSGRCVERPCAERRVRVVPVGAGMGLGGKEREGEGKGMGVSVAKSEGKGAELPVPVLPCGTGRCYLNTGWAAAVPAGTVCAEACSLPEHYEASVGIDGVTRCVPKTCERRTAVHGIGGGNLSFYVCGTENCYWDLREDTGKGEGEGERGEGGGCTPCEIADTDMDTGSDSGDWRNFERDETRHACVRKPCTQRTADPSRGAWPCGPADEVPRCLQDIGGADESRCVLACSNPSYMASNTSLFPSPPSSSSPPPPPPPRSHAHSHSIGTGADTDPITGDGRCVPALPCYAVEGGRDVCGAHADCCFDASRDVCVSVDSGEGDCGDGKGEGEGEGEEGKEGSDANSSRGKKFARTVVVVVMGVVVLVICMVFGGLVGCVVVWRRRKHRRDENPLSKCCLSNSSRGIGSESGCNDDRGSGDPINSDGYIKVLLLENDEVMVSPPTPPPSAAPTSWSRSRSSFNSFSSVSPQPSSSSSSTLSLSLLSLQGPPSYTSTHSLPYHAMSPMLDAYNSSASFSSSSSSSSSSAQDSCSPPAPSSSPFSSSSPSSMRSCCTLSATTIGDYTLIEVLGRGSCGEVYRCAKAGREYAIKRIESSALVDHMERNFANSISAQIRSKFLVEYYEALLDPCGRLYVVMELCVKGDLRMLISRCRMQSRKDSYLNPSRITKILTQLLLGLETLHGHKILHRDLKPENVFIDTDDVVKIGDFGCSRELEFSLQKARTAVGTPLYKSPEAMEGKEYDSSSDMWSLGVIVYEMCMLTLPFDGSSFSGLLWSVKAGKYKPISTSHNFDLERVADITKSLLSVNPKKRPSASELLKLPFIQKSAKKFKLLQYFPPN